MLSARSSLQSGSCMLDMAKHSMYLDPRVDLQEEVAPVLVDHELHGASIDIAYMLCDLHRIRMQRIPNVWVQPKCRRQLHHLQQVAILRFSGLQYRNALPKTLLLQAGTVW